MLGAKSFVSPRVFTVFIARSNESDVEADFVASPSEGVLRGFEFFRINPDPHSCLVLLVELPQDTSGEQCLKDCLALSESIRGPGLYLSRSAQDLARSGVDLDVVYEEAGVLTAETGAIRSERIYAILHPALPEPDISRSKPGLQGNCPRIQRSFIGRQSDIARFEDLIERRRLITVLGPPGIGKSALTLRVVRGFSDEITDGIWWFPVDDCTSMDDLLVRLSGQPGLCGESGSISVDGMAHRIASKEAVLVLDGCDRLIEPIRSFCKAVLALTSTLTIITTSTHALGIQGEQQLHVGPLSTGGDTTEPNEFALFESDALDLLYERSSESGVFLPFDEETVEQAMKLCRLVDGVPLAIEVIAASLRQSSLADLITSLEADLDSDEVDVTPEFGKLEIAIGTSYNALDSEEKELLSRLALFTGGWSIKIAEQAASSEWKPRRSVRVLHQLLFDHSWLTCEADHGIYRMLKPLRNYVLRHSEGLPLADHINGMLALLESTSGVVYASGNKSAEETMSRHYADWIQILEWSLNRADLTTFTQPLVKHLIPYWSRRNILEDATKYGEKVAARATGQDLVRVKMLLGIVAFRRRALKEARGHYRTARTESQKCKFHLGEAAAVCNIAMALSGEGKHEEAMKTYAEGIQLLRDVGDPRRLANALSNAAHALIVAAEGDSSPAAENFIKVAETYLVEAEAGQVEDPGILQSLHHSRARLALIRENLRAAEEEYRRAITICDENRLGHEAFEAVMGLGYVAWRASEYETAAKLLGLSKSILGNSGHAASDEDTARMGVVLSSLRRELGSLRCEKLMRYGTKLQLSELKKYAFTH